MEDILKFTGHDAQWGILSYKKWFKTGQKMVVNRPKTIQNQSKNGSKSVFIKIVKKFHCAKKRKRRLDVIQTCVWR